MSPHLLTSLFLFSQPTPSADGPATVEKPSADSDTASDEDTRRKPTVTTVVGEGKDRVVAPPPPDLERIAEINRKWRGVGIGLSNGLFGQSFAQGLRVDIPFGRRVGQFAGMRVEGRYVQPPAGTPGPYDPLITTGLGFWGRGPVWQGLFRVYGGGEAWVGIRPRTAAGGERVGFGGGGYVGTEFLVSDRFAFHFEIGGHGPTHRLRKDDAGARAMAGFTVYLGNLGKKRRDKK